VTPTNEQRGRCDFEDELFGTRVFDEDRYLDMFASVRRVGLKIF
jgi:hypothetical protein